jgi:hypothetical protein
MTNLPLAKKGMMNHPLFMTIYASHRRFIMNESTTTGMAVFTPAAPLAALGCYLHQIDLFAPIQTLVQIAQKKVVHTPVEKLSDAFITILAGAHGLVEVNTRLRSDPALQQAFGRTSCADQSTIQATLNACTTANVTQLQEALTQIYRQHGLAYRHAYADAVQILDVDLSGLLCGPTAALGTKGYFPRARNRRGRQLGRVLASRYQEVVTDQVFAGNTVLPTVLTTLILQAEQVLELDAAKRRRTIARIDAAGGSQDEVNWLLDRDYLVLTKEYSRQRSRKLAQSVTTWWPDPQIADRDVGWVTTPAPEYHHPVQRIAVRWRTTNGRWEYAVVISTVPNDVALVETGQPPALVADTAAVALTHVRLYDARGGGVETSFKEDKQGIGLTKRTKKRFAAQQMVVLLGRLAHNVLVWARGWLAPQAPHVGRYGLKRLVRDVFHCSGFLVRTAQGTITQIGLNHAAPLVHELARSLACMLAPQAITVREAVMCALAPGP